MYQEKRFLLASWISMIAVSFILIVGPIGGADLPEIKEKGVLRHLGVPYASFVTGSGDGLDVELVKLFAQQLEVQYQYVKTSWQEEIGDLTGKKVKTQGDEVEILGDIRIKGELAANGMTILTWREKVVDFSTPTFPTQIWLIARADSPVKPIKPSGDIEKDIARVKALLPGRQVLGILNTCVDPGLYGLKEARARVNCFQGELNELAPAIIYGDAEMTILDVPDALIALRKWPGKIKVIGPISPLQMMGFAFPKTSPRLREAFNRFFEQCKKDGTYLTLVRKYYPTVFIYFPEFFKDITDVN